MNKPFADDLQFLQQHTQAVVLGDPEGQALILAPQYLVLYGPQTARIDLGRHSTAEDAKACCEAHKAIATVCDQYGKGT